MVSQLFLAVDEPGISWAQAYGIRSVIGDILRQFLIQQALQHRTDLAISQALTEQAVIDFC